MTDTSVQIANIGDLRALIAKNYMKQINNFFGEEKRAMKFLSGVISSCQRNPKLLECEPTSLINSFMKMAQLEFMPSDVSGEAYVLPYNNKKQDGTQWVSVLEAQFQLGYQGLITLFYRAGARSITAEIVYEKDEFSIVNGEIRHSPDVFAPDRGSARGAYVIVELKNGGKVQKVMKKDDILAIGSRFSKSYKSKFSPWNPENDPDLWMWKKTVLKQVAKLVPKSDVLVEVIAEDNKDSDIEDRMKKAAEESESLKLGNFEKKSENSFPEPDDTAQVQTGGYGKGSVIHEEGCGVERKEQCTCIPVVNS